MKSRFTLLAAILVGALVSPVVHATNANDKPIALANPSCNALLDVMPALAASLPPHAQEHVVTLFIEQILELGTAESFDIVSEALSKAEFAKPFSKSKSFVQRMLEKKELLSPTALANVAGVVARGASHNPTFDPATVRNMVNIIIELPQLDYGLLSALQALKALEASRPGQFHENLTLYEKIAKHPKIGSAIVSVLIDQNMLALEHIPASIGIVKYLRASPALSQLALERMAASTAHFAEKRSLEDATDWIQLVLSPSAPVNASLKDLIQVVDGLKVLSEKSDVTSLAKKVVESQNTDETVFASTFSLPSLLHGLDFLKHVMYSAKAGQQTHGLVLSSLRALSFEKQPNEQAMQMLLTELQNERLAEAHVANLWTNVMKSSYVTRGKTVIFAAMNAKALGKETLAKLITNTLPEWHLELVGQPRVAGDVLEALTLHAAENVSLKSEADVLELARTLRNKLQAKGPLMQGFWGFGGKITSRHSTLINMLLRDPHTPRSEVQAFIRDLAGRNAETMPDEAMDWIELFLKAPSNSIEREAAMHAINTVAQIHMAKSETIRDDDLKRFVLLTAGNVMQADHLPRTGYFAAKTMAILPKFAKGESTGMVLSKAIKGLRGATESRAVFDVILDAAKLKFPFVGDTAVFRDLAKSNLATREDLKQIGIFINESTLAKPEYAAGVETVFAEIRAKDDGGLINEIVGIADPNAWVDIDKVRTNHADLFDSELAGHLKDLKKVP